MSGLAATLRRRRTEIVATLAALAVASGAAYCAWLGLKTCGWLDRLTGRSGCVARLTVAGFSPELFETMLVSPESGALGLFGEARGPDGWRLALVRIDLDAMRELGRSQLPMVPQGPDIMRVAADGRRAVLFCGDGGPCVEGGGAALVVNPDAPEDAETLAKADRYRGAPPGSADFPKWAEYKSALMPDGATLASLDDDTGAVVLRRLADGAETARLSPKTPFKAARFDQSLAISPSGRLIALVTASNPPKLKVGTMVRIYDVARGREVATIATDEDFEAKATTVFTRDERRIVLVRRLLKGGDAEIALFAPQTDTETRP